MYKRVNKALTRTHQGGLDPFSQTPYGSCLVEIRSFGISDRSTS